MSPLLLDRARQRAAAAVESLTVLDDTSLDQRGLEAVNEHTHAAFIACLVAALVEDGVDPVDVANRCGLDAGGIDFWLQIGNGYLAAA